KPRSHLLAVKNIFPRSYTKMHEDEIRPISPFFVLLRVASWMSFLSAPNGDFDHLSSAQLRRRTDAVERGNIANRCAISPCYVTEIFTRFHCISDHLCRATADCRGRNDR